MPTPLGVLATEHASCARNLHLAMPFAGLDFVMSPDEKILSGFSVLTIPDLERIQKFPLWKADST